ERVANVEVVQPEQLTTLALEPDGVAPGEQLESTAEARAGAARAPSHGGQPPEVAGEEADQPVVLAQIPGAKHDSLGAEQRHGWRRGSGGQPVAQLAQRVVVTPPVLPDLHPELEEYRHAEERLQLAPRRLPDALEHGAAFPDHDGLLGRLLDEDH